MSYYLHVRNVDLKDKSPLAWHVLIKLIGLSMVSLFLPAMLRFEFGLSISQIFLYEAFFSIVVLIISHFGSLAFTARYGTVASMLLGVAVFSLNFLVLYFAKQVPELLILSPLCAGIYVAYFWTGYHTALALQTKDINFAAGNSFLESISVVAGLVGPLLGGWLADYYGSEMLYTVTFFCLLSSCIPFFFHQTKHVPIHFSSTKMFAIFKKDPAAIKAMCVSFASMNYVYFVGSVVWSIILFEFLQTYTKLAFVSAISGAILLFLFYIVGKEQNKHKMHISQFFSRLLTWSFWGQGSTWLVAGLVIVVGSFSQLLFICIDTIHKITYRVNELSIMTYFYETIGERNSIATVLQFIFLRELALHVPKVLFCLIFAGITALLKGYAHWGLILCLFLVFFIAPFGNRFIIWKQGHDAHENI